MVLIIGMKISFGVSVFGLGFLTFKFRPRILIIRSIAIIGCFFWNPVTGWIGQSCGPNSARWLPVDDHCVTLIEKAFAFGL